MKTSTLRLVSVICLIASCTTPHSNQYESIRHDNISVKPSFSDDSIEIVQENNSNLRNTIYIVYDGFDIAKYHFIGSIRKGLDSIQFVHFLLFFNIDESMRCNSKMLIYRNRLLMGYYPLGSDDFHFEMRDGVMTCNPKGNSKILSLLDFDPKLPNDWFILYTIKDNLELGDSVFFVRCDTNMCEDYLPRQLMFINQ